jgi:putative ATP-dependent endonuclease of OLD family
LNNENGSIKTHEFKKASISKDDKRQFDYKIRNDRGSLLFARCWILGEGQTEDTIIPHAVQLLGYDIEQLGILVIGFQEGLSIEPAIIIAKTFGIQCAVITDNDTSGKSFCIKAKKHIKEQYVFAMSEKAIEEYLCYNGFLKVYEKLKSEQEWEKRKVSTDASDYPTKIAESLSLSKNFERHLNRRILMPIRERFSIE